MANEINGSFKSSVKYFYCLKWKRKLFRDTKVKGVFEQDIF